MIPNIIPSSFGPLPNIPETNFVYTLLHSSSPSRPRPPDDYVSHIDGITGERRTFQEFMARINQVGSAFCAPEGRGGLGLQPGKDMVGLLSDNCIDYPVVVFALLQGTIPLALLNSHSTPSELVHQIKLTGVTHLLVGPTSLITVKRALQLAELTDIGITILEGCGAKAHSSEVSLQQLINRTKEPAVQPTGIAPVKRDTLAYLVFSSGTSGLPKAVMISHGNLNAAYTQFLIWSLRWIEVQPLVSPVYTQYPVHLAFLPMYHSMGLHVYNLRLLSPVTLVVLPSWNPEAVLRCISKYRVTNLALVPSLVFQLLAYPNLRSNLIDLSSLASIGAGAAYLPPTTEKELIDTVGAKGQKGAKVKLNNGYGLSEATIGVTSQPVDGMLNGKLKRRTGSVGTLLPGIEIRLCYEASLGTLVEDLVDVPSGEPGELYVRGLNNALGYWKNQKATKETFLPGNWMRTGDRFVYKDGHLWFQDRVKDTLKVSGVQVSPTEIEAVLKAHPNAYLLEACVAGVSGLRDDGELIPKAWVVLSAAGHNAGTEKVVADLDAWVRGQLSKPKHLRGGIEIVHSIPKNPTGKVLRRILQDKDEKRHKMYKSKL